MITFVDTDILLDLFLPDPEFGDPSAALVERAYDAGSLVINAVVYTELATQFIAPHPLNNALRLLGIRILPINAETAFEGGSRWRTFQNAGEAQARSASDFLIGAHAERHADRLLTRNQRFYQRYFPNLVLLT